MTVAQDTLGAKRILAYVLFSIFHSLAQNQEGEAIDVGEAETTFNALNEPICGALEYLDEDDGEERVLNLTVDLLNAHIPPPRYQI